MAAEAVAYCLTERQRRHDTLPVLYGRLMMLVIGNFQREQITRVNKHRIHWL